MEDIHNNTKTDPESLSYPTTLMSSTICLISITAFGEHLVVLLITCVSKTLRKKPYVLSILLLSSSDILFSMGMFLYALFNLASLRQTWIYGLTYFLMQLGFASSLGHTLIICTERYLLTRPIPMAAFSLRKRQALTLINTGICSIMIGLPYLFSVREPTVEKCNLVTIFRENFSYALVPVRSISFLIWMCTVVIYVRTAKNFRNAVRRTDRLVESHLTQNNTFSKVVKAPDKVHIDINTACQSCSSAGLCIVKEGSDHSPEINHHTRNTNPKIKLRNATQDEDVTATNASYDAFHSVPEGKIQTNIRGPLPDKSNDTSSTSRPGKVIRHTKSKPHSQGSTEAFRIVSVVFVVFLISMTPQSVVGLVMIIFPMQKSVEFGCASLAICSTVTNPFMYAFLLKDFRQILRCK